MTGTVDTSFDVDMYDIDLFDTPTATINKLKQMGRVVICYFSGGSWEDWRDDADDFPAAVRGNTLSGWPDEKWLDIRSSTIKPLMEARLDVAVSKGCDGVEPDNMDGYTHSTGFGITPANQIAYNKWMAGAAHARGLSVGLKNDVDQVGSLVGDYDWALNEQCFQYSECSKLDPFVAAGKAVFGVEYQGTPATFCPQLNKRQFSWLKKDLDVKAPVAADCLADYAYTRDTATCPLCTATPCQHNGTCVVSADSATRTCSCANGYEGASCEKDSLLNSGAALVAPCSWCLAFVTVATAAAASSTPR